MEMRGRNIFGTRTFASAILFLAFALPLANLASSQVNSFTLEASPNSVTVSQAGEATVTLIVKPVEAFSEIVYFQPANVTGLPDGVTVSFQPEQVTLPANVTMTFAVSLYTANGSYEVEVYAVSGSINQSVQVQLTVIEDKISPTTSLAIGGVLGPEGKYGSDVLVTLVAEDNVNGSGVAETAYNINNSSWIRYDEPFLVNLDGNFTIQYNSTDYAGNVEQTKTENIIVEKPIKIDGDATYTNSLAVDLELTADHVISNAVNMSFSNNNMNWTEWETYADTRAWNLSDIDGLKTVYVKFENETYVSPAYFDTITLVTTPPNTTVSLSGATGDNGWYISDVQIEFQVNSAALLNETWYRLDDGDWTKYDQPINITIEGQILVEFYSTDKAGNIEETKNTTVKVDKTTPTITITSPEARIYALNESVMVIFNASDLMSGLADVTAALDNNPVQNDSAPSLSVGEHILNVTALDLAGNTATKAVTFSVADSNGGDDGDEGGPTTQTTSVNNLKDIIVDAINDGAFKNKGTAQSLIAKLEACQRKIDEGQFKTAMNILNAFKNHVQAQSGKHIPEGLAAELLAEANILIDALNGAP